MPWKKPNGSYGANWEKTKIIVRERDGYECTMCGKSKGSSHEFNVHHIDLNKSNNDEQNLTYLCLSCHKILHRMENRYTEEEIVDFLTKAFDDNTYLTKIKKGMNYAK